MEAFIAVYSETSCFHLLHTRQMCTPSADGLVLPSNMSENWPCASPETMLFHWCSHGNHRRSFSRFCPLTGHTVRQQQADLAHLSLLDVHAAGERGPLASR